MAMASPSVAEAFFFEELQATAGHREAAWLSSGAYCPRRGRSCSCRSLRATRGLNERGVAMGRAPPPPRRGVALGSVTKPECTLNFFFGDQRAGTSLPPSFQEHMRNSAKKKRSPLISFCQQSSVFMWQKLRADRSSPREKQFSEIC